jgi:hypothetical protein
MPKHARERRPAGPVVGALAVLLLLAACARDGVPDLAVRAHQALPEPGFQSLYVDGAGRSWVGRPGRLARLDGAAVAAAVATAGAEVPRVVGGAGGRLVVRVGARVLALDPESAEVMAERAEMAGILSIDPLERYLYRATGSGAVLAYDAVSLEPRWGWAALGAPATAATGSLLGDRLYLALSDTAGAGAPGGEVLIRDLQTGRVLSRVFFPVPLAGLLPDPRGGLVALLREEGGGAVMGLGHAQGDLPLRWRHTLDELGLEAEPQLRASARTPRIAVFGEGNENGLHVLDAETGRRIGRVREAVLDAGFGADGALYLLDATSIRVVDPLP